MRSQVSYLYYIMTLDLDSMRIPLIESKVRIRNIKPEIEKDTFINLFNSTFRHSKNPFVPLNPDEFDRIPPEDIFVAEKPDGKLVGFIIVNVEEQAGEKVGLISHIGISPGERKAGIATLLAIHGGLYLKSEGVKKWVCEVYSENELAVNFIKKFGFKIEKEVIVVGSDIRNVKPFYSHMGFNERLTA